MKLYGLLSVISLFIRQFYLPNPFECFGEQAIIINWIAEPIIQAVSYSIVGLFYNKGSAPALGSLGFLSTYTLLVVMLWLCGMFSFAWWWILTIIIGCIIVSIGIMWLKERFCQW